MAQREARDISQLIASDLLIVVIIYHTTIPLLNDMMNDSERPLWDDGTYADDFDFTSSQGIIKKEVDFVDHADDIENGQVMVASKRRTSSPPEELGRQFSALDPRDDPFAQREGKMLIWKNVDMILVSSYGRRLRSEEY
jgi:hypothetical protein